VTEPPDDFCGPIPARTEVTVLGPDDPDREPLGFVVREYNGSPVYKSLDPGPDGKPVPLRLKEDLRPGDVALSPSMFSGGHPGNGYFEFTVAEMEDGRLYGKAGGSAVFLRFAEDDRACWCAVGFSVGRGITKLEIKTGG
jgi:hypothetical protein